MELIFQKRVSNLLKRTTVVDLLNSFVVIDI